MRVSIVGGAACAAALALTAAWADETAVLTAGEQAVVELVNKERAAAGLPALKSEPHLVVAAHAHSANMAKQDKLNHILDGQGPTERIQATGYRAGAWGENVAAGQTSPEEAVKGWMGSQFHRANILSRDFTETGVGIARDIKGMTYYTQVFASPLPK